MTSTDPYIAQAEQARAAVISLAEHDDQALAADFRAAVEALSHLAKRATSRHVTLTALAHRVQAADAELKRLGKAGGTRSVGIMATPGDTASARLYGRDGARTVTASPVARIIAAAVELATQNETLVESLLTLRTSARVVLADVPAMAADWRINAADRAHLTPDQLHLAALHGRLA